MVPFFVPDSSLTSIKQTRCRPTNFGARASRRQSADIIDYWECWRGTLARQSASWQGSWPKRHVSPRVRARLDRDDEPLRGRDVPPPHFLKRHYVALRSRDVSLSPAWLKSPSKQKSNSWERPAEFRHEFHSLRKMRRRHITTAKRLIITIQASTKSRRHMPFRPGSLPGCGSPGSEGPSPAFPIVDDVRGLSTRSPRSEVRGAAPGLFY